MDWKKIGKVIHRAVDQQIHFSAPLNGPESLVAADVLKHEDSSWGGAYLVKFDLLGVPGVYLWNSEAYWTQLYSETPKEVFGPIGTVAFSFLFEKENVMQQRMWDRIISQDFQYQRDWQSWLETTRLALQFATLEGTWICYVTDTRIPDSNDLPLLDTQMKRQAPPEGSIFGQVLLKFERLKSTETSSSVDASGPGLAKYKYDIAISFAGEDRSIAEYFAKRLDASGYSVFYDEYEADRLWGSDLPVELGRIYAEQARFCLMVVSHYYVAKMWTNHERQHAISRLMKRGGGYILPLKLDDSEIPGLPSTIGYQSLQSRSLDDIYGILLSRLGAPQTERSAADNISPEDKRRVRDIIQACYRRALFTKMDSEISLDAMFRSLGRSIGLVQEIISKLENPALQHLGLRIVRGLDRLERYRMRYSQVGVSLRIPPRDRRAMDDIKLDIIGALLELRRRGGLVIQLPTTLAFDHFFSTEEADLPPDHR